MGVRNCEDLGENMQKIVRHLMKNDELIKLLYYTEKNPYDMPNLTDEQKKQLIFNKLIKYVPRVPSKTTAQSEVVVYIVRGTSLKQNREFKDVRINIEVFVPITQWAIQDTNLRPFAILGQIQKSLDGLTINGLGRLDGGDFELQYITDEMSNYVQYWSLNSYD